MLTTPAIFPYLNFLLEFCPVDSSETTLMSRFAKLDIGAGKTSDWTNLSAESERDVSDGIKDSAADLETIMKRINTDQIASSDMFGAREFLKNNYLYRYAGAKLGLYRNSGAEASYFGYFVDAAHRPLDASRNNYQLHFAKRQLPEHHASRRSRL